MRKKWWFGGCGAKTPQNVRKKWQITPKREEKGAVLGSRSQKNPNSEVKWGCLGLWSHRKLKKKKKKWWFEGCGAKTPQNVRKKWQITPKCEEKGVIWGP